MGTPTKRSGPAPLLTFGKVDQATRGQVHMSAPKPLHCRVSPVPPSIDTPSAVPEVLDSKIVAQLQALDRTDMTDLIEIFIADTIGHLKSLRRAVRTSNRAFVAKKSHGLQGSSASIGAVRMANLCGQLEVAGDSEDNSRGLEILGLLETEFGRVERALGSASEYDSIPSKRG